MYEKEVIQLPQDFPFLTFATDARQMVMHQHDCLEINRILSGSGTYWIEEKQYEILPEIFLSSIIRNSIWLCMMAAS